MFQLQMPSITLDCVETFPNIKTNKENRILLIWEDIMMVIWCCLGLLVVQR